jgi:hypothetical protein
LNIRDRKIASEFGSEIMIARFRAKAILNETNGCHEWQGCLQSRGYGQVRLSGKVEYAHRLAWRLAGREIPTGLYVLHQCDNPKCVNPEHLFLGTQAENLADMQRKGRGRRPYPKELPAEERLAAKRERNRRWRKQNRAHISAYNRAYQEKHQSAERLR